MAEEKPIKRTWNFKDLTGLRFGKWTVLSFHEIRNIQYDTLYYRWEIGAPLFAASHSGRVLPY